jgi:G:T-mismatch repair DNA endonuclease (very short patch repair protein)
MLTAKQARDLAGPTVEERIEDVLKDIEAAAKNKSRELHCHQDFWVNEGYSGTENYKKAKKMLEDLGYKVEFYYECRQFVDMYTIIRW